MRLIITLFMAMVFCAGCKKAVREAQEDIIIKAMTDGEWTIVSFSVDNANITTEFAEYSFKYHSNKTVDAIHSGAVEKTGSWDGDIETRTTWANFTDAGPALTLINGSWHIDDNSWTYVVATQTDGNEIKKMRLEKR